MIKKFENFNTALHDYMNDKIDLTPSLNIAFSATRDELDVHAEIGKYFLEKAGEDYLKVHKTLLDRIKSDKKAEDSYVMLGIYFICEYLNEDSLKKMFGKPLCHSEFGENFDKRRKYDYCSYFFNINGKNVHIGYDHRGTRIEVDKNTTPDELLDILKKLVDEYCKYINNI